MRLHPLLKSLAAITSLCVMLAGGQAHAALTTITTTGTIDAGYDTSGVFGSAGADLTGLSYSQAITVDATLYANQLGSGHCGFPCNIRRGTLTGTATNTVTVGSVTQMFTWDLSRYHYGQTYLANGLSMSSYSEDQIIQYQEGFTSNGSYLSALANVYSYTNAFGISLSFDQSAFYTLQPGDFEQTYFSLSGTDSAYFQDYLPATISINGGNVPEPATLALFALALVGAGLTRRRKGAL